MATVGGVAIPKASYEHWVRVDKALRASGNVGHRALGFLITSEWVVGEAAAAHVTVSEAEVEARLAETEKRSFPKAGSLQSFLARSGESEADLRAIVSTELLKEKIATAIAAGKSGSMRDAALGSYEITFRHRWKAATKCEHRYVMEDCAGFRGKEEAGPVRSPAAASSGGEGRPYLGAPAGQPSKSGRGGRSVTPAGTSPAGASGAAPAGENEPKAPVGSFQLTSPAFVVGQEAPMPAQYTCAGKDISPPFEFKNIPSGTAALMLVVEFTNKKGSKVVWAVGNISPGAEGVAEGKTPEGGVVGVNGEGQRSWSGICPAAGEAYGMQFSLYALKSKLALGAGFSADTAEKEVVARKLLLQTSVTAQG